MSKSPSFAGHVIGGTAPYPAHVEFALTHDLGVVPGDAFIIGRVDRGRIYRGPTAWTDTTIYLRSNVPGTQFQLMLIAGTASAGSGFVATVVRKVSLAASATTQTDVPAWPDGSTNAARFFFAIPSDYDSGDLEFTLFRRSSVTANTAVMRRASFRFRNATAFVTIVSGVNIDYTPGNTNTNQLVFTVTAANFAEGDIIRIDVERLGADASDTMAGFVDMDGLWVTYTATL